MKQRLKSLSDLPFSLGVPAILWQVLFFYLPLLFLFVSSFIVISDAGAVKVTLQKIVVFFQPLYLKIIFSSILLGLSNVILCFLIAYPLAYFLAFKSKKWKNVMFFFIIIPFWTNFLLHVYAWFFVLEKEGFINNLLRSVGVIDTPIHFLNSIFSIMVMMVYYYLPFMLFPIYASLEKFDRKLIEASLDMGASFMHTLRRVLLPLTMGGIRSGFFLVYVPSFAEFAIPELMGGNKQMFVGNAISLYILGEETGEFGAAFTVVSILFLLVSAIGFYILIRKLLMPKRRHV